MSIDKYISIGRIPSIFLYEDDIQIFLLNRDDIFMLGLYTDHVHDAEGLLELLDSGVGEGVEDVGFLGHVEAGGSERELGDLKFGPESLQIHLHTGHRNFIFLIISHIVHRK